MLRTVLVHLIYMYCSKIFGLQYAMPRVPLKNIKERQTDMEDATEPSDTMVGAIAKRIHEAHKARRNAPKDRKVLLDGDIENEPDSDQIDSDQVYFEDNRLEGATAMARACEPKVKNLHRKGQENGLWDHQLNLDEEEMIMMKRLEAKIQMKHGRKNLKLVVVESDTEQDLPGNDENSNEDFELSGQHRLFNNQQVQTWKHKCTKVLIKQVLRQKIITCWKKTTQQMDYSHLK